MKLAGYEIIQILHDKTDDLKADYEDEKNLETRISISREIIVLLELKEEIYQKEIMKHK